MELLLKAIQFFAFYTMIGTVFFNLVLAKPKLKEIVSISTRWKLLIYSSLLILLLATCVSFVLHIAIITDSTLFETISNIIPILQHTHYGLIFILKMSLLILLAVILIYSKDNLVSNKIAILLLLLLLGIAYTFTAVSHAADKGSFTVAALIDWLHVVATAIWGGSILITLFIFFNNMPKDFFEQRTNLSGYICKLSNLCAYALVFVLFTGLYKIVNIESNGLALWQTNYGQTLCYKLIFVVLLLGLGAVNRYVLCPSIAKWAQETSNINYNPMRLITYVLLAQGGILCVILAITSKLVSQSPSL